VIYEQNYSVALPAARRSSPSKFFCLLFVGVVLHQEFMP